MFFTVVHYHGSVNIRKTTLAKMAGILLSSVLLDSPCLSSISAHQALSIPFFVFMPGISDPIISGIADPIEGWLCPYNRQGLISSFQIT